MDLRVGMALDLCLPLHSFTRISLFWFSLLLCFYFLLWLHSFCLSLSLVCIVCASSMRVHEGQSRMENVLFYYSPPHSVETLLSFTDSESRIRTSARNSPSRPIIPTHTHNPQHWGYKLAWDHAQFLMWMLKIGTPIFLFAQLSILSTKSAPQFLLCLFKYPIEDMLSSSTNSSNTDI